jgi:alpha-glucosidase
MTVRVDTSNLCITVTDKIKSLALTTICPVNLSQASKGLTISPSGIQHVYGLGEQFIEPPGNPNGDWTGRVRTPGDNFGNQMIGFDGGANGNAQFPVMYAVGANNANYALFLDHIYKQRWDFTGNPWKVETLGDPIRGYLMTGPNLPALRQDFMEPTGHPPVPPKKMFGLWVSEYGYDNWEELEGKLKALHADKFPVDGFVLDLQWFGGITSGSDNSNMGRVSWDPTHFPNAANKLATYKG